MRGLDIRRVRTHHQDPAQIFRTMSKRQRKYRAPARKPRKPCKPGKPLKFKIDPNDGLVLILANGRRIRQKKGLDLFTSPGGYVYSLTRYGLRKRRIDFCQKKRLGKRTQNGVSNGRRYPYITFRGKTYPVHILMIEIWVRPRREGEEIDHLDGNIDNFALNNLELVTVEENLRRRKILTAMRKAARDLHDHSLDPANKSPETMARIYRDITVDDPAKIMESDFTQYREY